jgi:hypothetical protein
VVASILALQNLIASVGVALSAAYSPSQKCLQLTLIWLVPVFGAGIALYFLRENFSIKNGIRAPKAR